MIDYPSFQRKTSHSKSDHPKVGHAVTKLQTGKQSIPMNREPESDMLRYAETHRRGYRPCDTMTAGSRTPAGTTHQPQSCSSIPRRSLLWGTWVLENAVPNI